MKGPKFVVLEMKDLIRSAIIALVGIAVIVSLIYFLVPTDESTTKKREKERENTFEEIDFQKEGAYDDRSYLPGAYKSQIILHNHPVDVVVEVTADEIIDIRLDNLPSNQDMFYPLFSVVLEDIREYILYSQTTTLTPYLEKETTTSILIDAINAALEKATILPASKTD